MANKLRDKVTGKFQSQGACADRIETVSPSVSAPPVVSAALKVAELQSHESAIKNRLVDLENEYEQLDKHREQVAADLDKARAELSRLM